jgi:hypothetical protein
MSRRSFEVDRLDEWQAWLNGLENGRVDSMKDRILRTAGLRVQEYLTDLTPAQTSRLRGSMSQGHPDNVYEMQVGGKSYVIVGTNVEYAEHVNDGHKQQKGRFIPGEWSSGTFHYMPGHSSGMVLSGKVIPGARMFDKAKDYMEDDLDEIVEFEFRRLYSELF